MTKSETHPTGCSSPHPSAPGAGAGRAVHPRWIAVAVIAIFCAGCAGCAEGVVAPCQGAQCVDLGVLADAPDVGIIDTRQDDSGDTATNPDTSTRPDTVPADTVPADTHVSPDVADTSVPPDISQPAILGLPCGVDVASGCTPSAPTWPGCTILQCPGGECSLLGDNGYCTPACASDADCTNVHANSVVGASFTCVKDATDSTCVPGSNTACDHDGQCAGGELCKLGYVESAGDLVVTTVCQTATLAGAQAGQPCNTEPELGALVHCANDLCLGSVCGGFCDPGNAQSCGGAALECMDNVELVAGFVRPFCSGVSCTADAQCTAPGYHCLPTAKGSTPETWTARCFYGSQASSAGAMGASCSDSDGCASGWCLTEGDAATGTCSNLCANDGECGANQKCAALRVQYDAAGPTQALPICRVAAGSRDACEGDVDCPFDEICHTYLVGSALDNFTTFVGSVDRTCTKPVWSTGKAAGQPCDPDAGVECANDLCLTADGGASWFCSAVCVASDDWDCPGSMVCDASLAVWGSGSTAISHMVCTP